MLKATVTDKLVAVAFILNKKRIPFQAPHVKPMCELGSTHITRPNNIDNYIIAHLKQKERLSGRPTLYRYGSSNELNPICVPIL